MPAPTPAPASFNF